MSEDNGRQLPTGWARTTLAEVVDILDSRRVPINSKERAKRVGEIPYYGATGQVGWIDDHLFDEDLVLLGEDGAPFFDPTKNIAYLIRGKSWVNNHAHVLLGRSGVLNQFLLHQLNQADFHGFVSGTTRPKLPQGPMKQMPFLLAPKAEQPRLVEKIEELLSDLDTGVAALERVRRNLKRYRASVLKAAVEGRLTEAWRAEHQDVEPASELLARILKERRRRWEANQLAAYKAKGKTPPKGWKQKYKEPTQPDTTGLPDLPTTWQWATLDQLGNVGTGTTPRRGLKEYWKDGTVPWVTSGAVNDFLITEPTASVTDRALMETRLSIYPRHTLLLAMYGEGKTRGKVAELLIESTINQALAAIVLPDCTAPCRAFVKNALLAYYDRTRSRSSGGVQPNLNLELVKGIAVPIPPVAEQIDIVDHIDNAISIAGNVNAAAQQSLLRSSRLRQSILKRAFEGKLVPQDLNDEPASVLLDRIRSGWEAKPKKPRSRAKTRQRKRSKGTASKRELSKESGR